MKHKIEIKNGAMNRRIEVESKTTIGQLKAELGKKFSLTNDHQAYVSMPGMAAVMADDNTEIQEGQVIDFHRNVGQKG